MNDVFSPEQIAEILDCTPETAEEHLRSGNLPGIKFGRSWRSPREAFFARLNELATKQAEERRAPPGKVTWLNPKPTGKKKPLVGGYDATKGVPPNPTPEGSNSA